jgi:hypothetical protein
MTNLQTDNIFEFRLGGGVALRFGPPRAGDGGVARILTVPALFRNSDLAAYFDEGAKPTWTVAPDSKAKQGICSLWVSGGHQCLFIDLLLPATDFQTTGLSTFEHWLRVIREAKDDLNKDVRLRLIFNAHDVQSSAIAALKDGKSPSTPKMELSVKPSVVQWQDGC